jgi:hypothetical protein
MSFSANIISLGLSISCERIGQCVANHNPSSRTPHRVVMPSTEAGLKSNYPLPVLLSYFRWWLGDGRRKAVGRCWLVVGRKSMGRILFGCGWRGYQPQPTFQKSLVVGGWALGAITRIKNHYI